MTGNAKSTILVVDDEESNLDLMDAYMEDEYNLVFASSGTEALEKANENIDLILLDVLMPAISGFEVCRKLKSNTDTKYIPVILVTALSKRDNLQKGIDSGADDFLAKPVDMLEIQIRVKSLLRIKHQRDTIIEDKNKAQKYRDHLDKLIKTSPIAILYLDEYKNILDANKSAISLLGYDGEEILGKNISSILKDDSSLEMEDKKDFTIEFLQKNGKSVSMNVSTSMVEDEESGTGMIVTMQDLKKLKGLFITPLAEREYNEDVRLELSSIENGYSYIIDNADFKTGYDAFSCFVKSGYHGLCISRMNPDHIRKSYDLYKTPLIWLTKNQNSTDPVIEPSEIFKIPPTITNFIDKVENGLIFIDGLEYLILENDFRSIIKLIEQINDSIMASSSKLIIQIDPHTMEQKEYHLFKRWMRKLPLDAIENIQLSQ